MRYARASIISVASVLALAACAAVPPAPTDPARRAAAPATEIITVEAEAGRTVDIAVTRPRRVRGAMLFGHGGGSEPSQYTALTDAFAREGWLVLTPRHRDSRAHPDRVAFAGPAGFGARIAELEAAAGLAQRLAPGKPLVAAGHSYGSLFATMRGGAFAGMGSPPRVPVAAVLALSSPGRIPGIVGPGSFRGLAVPTMVITGDADLVPGFVTDWRQHLAAFDDSPAGGKYALVLKGGTHSGVADPAGPAFAAARDFLASHALDDRAARARLASLVSTEALEIRRR